MIHLLSIFFVPINLILVLITLYGVVWGSHIGHSVTVHDHNWFIILQLCYKTWSFHGCVNLDCHALCQVIISVWRIILPLSALQNPGACNMCSYFVYCPLSEVHTVVWEMVLFPVSGIWLANWQLFIDLTLWPLPLFPKVTWNSKQNLQACFPVAQISSPTLLLLLLIF